MLYVKETMKLSDLNKIKIEDLKQIDLRQVRENLQSRPDLIIQIVLVLITILTIFSTCNTHKEKTASLKKEVLELRKKSKALEKFETTQKDYNEYIKDTPQVISKIQLSRKISESAERWDIKILSTEPTQEKSNTYVHLTNIKINVSSKNYANIIQFIHDIENSPYLIRIKGVTTSLENKNLFSRRRHYQDLSQQASGEPIIEATIEIESLEFKNV